MRALPTAPDAHDCRVRRRQRRRRPDVHRRGARRQRGPAWACRSSARPGKLLDKLLAEIGLDRKDVFICNVLKCRPPDNRDPHPNEIEACNDYLRRQVDLIEPTVICTLGQLLDQAAARRHHRDLAPARPRGGADHRPPRGPPVPAISPGGRAVHAVDARGAAGRLPPHPRAAGARAARAAADVRAGPGARRRTDARDSRADSELEPAAQLGLF